MLNEEKKTVKTTTSQLNFMKIQFGTERNRERERERVSVSVLVCAGTMNE